MGRLDIGHSESSVYWLRLRAEFNQLLGVDSRIIGPAEIKDLVPPIDLREGKPLPIMAALYHPPAGVVRHDAVVWGMARGADRAGVELHPFTEVTGITRENGRVTGVETPSGRVGAGVVVSATAGWTSTITAMVDLEVPIVTFPLQACVTEPVKPYVHTTISSADLHVYVYQTDRGELVIGGPVDPYSTYSQKSTLDMLHELAASTLELLPELRDIKILRQWAGLCEHDARLRADHGQGGRARRVHTELRLGHVGLQGRPRVGQDHRRADRHRQDARADRELQPAQVRRQHAGQRARRRNSRRDPLAHRHRKSPARDPTQSRSLPQSGSSVSLMSCPKRERAVTISPTWM